MAALPFSAWGEVAYPAGITPSKGSGPPRAGGRGCGGVDAPVTSGAEAGYGMEPEQLVSALE